MLPARVRAQRPSSPIALEPTPEGASPNSGPANRRQLGWTGDDRLGDASVVVARHALALGNLLIFDGGLQHHAVREIIDHPALDLLPWRLVRRILIAAMALQVGAAPVVFLLADQDVGAALGEIDAHAISGPEDGKPPARCRLRRGIEDRR